MDFKRDDEADDIFASLGGSLMQELLADLNDDGDTGWLSLEQLEKELAHLDVNSRSTSLLGGAAGAAAAFPTTAASLVVSAQQQMATTTSSSLFPGGGGGGPPGLGGGGGGVTEPPVLPVDAWSLSLQKFTEASLEADFLQADSARKQKKTTTTTTAADSLFAQLDLSAAEEYNLAEPIRLAQEPVTVAPPPGLAAASTTSSMMKPDIVQQVASRLEHEQQIHKDDVVVDDDDDDVDEPVMVPMRPKPAPPTPQNSRTIFPLTPQNSSRLAIPSNIPKPPPPTPQNSVTIINNQVYTGDSSSRREEEDAVQPPTNTTATAAAAGAKQPTPSATAASTSRRSNVVPPTPANSMHNTPQQPATTPAAPAWQQLLVAATPVMPSISGPNDVSGRPVLSPSAAAAPGPHPMQQQQQQQPQSQAWGQPPSVMATPPMMIRPGHHHQQQQQQPRRRVVYANPHPNAPPIPAAALSSKYMSTRDISYVIHAILKPILLAEQQRGRETDYDQAYWRRHIQGPSPTGGGLGPYQKKGRKDMHAKEMESRHQKAKEWSSEHAVLGQTAKTNVTRPRALIAQPRVGKGGDDEAGGAGALTNDQRQRLQRQALWKARIYCDQAYQAYSRVVEMWRTASAGPSSTSGVPPGLQPHLVKLLKCLGITSTNKITTGPDGTSTKREKEYHSDETVLALQMKLPKGRVLLARVLEQALLPPPAVQVLLPTALKVSYESKTTTGQDDDQQHQQQPHQQQHDPVDDRLFAAWTRVVQHLPNLSGSSILQAMHIVQTNAKEALRTTCRMQMVHALLQRGGLLAAASSAPAVPETDDPTSSSFAPKWTTVESDFMKFLEGGGVSA